MNAVYTKIISNTDMSTLWLTLVNPYVLLLVVTNYFLSKTKLNTISAVAMPYGALFRAYKGQ